MIYSGCATGSDYPQIEADCWLKAQDRVLEFSIACDFRLFLHSLTMAAAAQQVRAALPGTTPAPEPLSGFGLYSRFVSQSK